MPVIPATLEADAGESLEPGRGRLQSAEIVPLHFSLDNKNKTQSQNNNNKNTFAYQRNYPLKIRTNLALRTDKSHFCTFLLKLNVRFIEK